MHIFTIEQSRTMLAAMDAAPPSAELVSVSISPQSVALMRRNSVGGFTVLSAHPEEVQDLIEAGAAAGCRSLWNYDRNRFETGTLAQLMEGED